MFSRMIWLGAGSKQQTSVMTSQDVADSLSVKVDPLDSGSEIATVPLHDDRIFSPVVVLVLDLHRHFQLPVEIAVWVQHRAWRLSTRVDKNRKALLPSTHDIAVPAEYLRQTANDDVGVRQHMHIQEISNSLVHHNGEAVLGRQLSDPLQIR